MEELILTDPEVKPEEVKSSYKIVSLLLDHEQLYPVVPPAVPEPGLVEIWLKDNLGGKFHHVYTGKAAQDYIKYINTANFSTKSLHKRLLEKLSIDGVLPGTVTGTPDPPVMGDTNESAPDGTENR